MKKFKQSIFLILVPTICSFLSSGCHTADAEKVGVTNIAVPSYNSPQNTTLTQNSLSQTQEKQSKESKDLFFLDDWVGKYPINKANKKYSNLFEISQIKKLLVEAVGSNNLQNLLRHFAAPVLVEKKGGFIKIFGTTINEGNQNIGYGLIAIEPTTEETQVFLVDDGRLKTFGNDENGGTLPMEIKESILAYVEPSSIIGTTKEKPDEGYLCYAVLPKDWDAVQNKRPYVFYTTDNGGKLNIEGADIELKRILENERQGEGGKTYVEWIYENKKTRAHFDLVVAEIPDSSAVFYEGKLTVTTSAKIQTLQVKAFCGG